MKVNEAIDAREALTGREAQLHDLIEACLNAEAAFCMMGCKPVPKGEFQPVGVQTLMQIEALLATMPEETALVKDSMAFSCEFCGNPAETSSDDCWICEDCYAAAAGEVE